MLSIIRKILLTVITLIVGVTIGYFIIKTKPQALLKPQVSQGVLVETQRFTPNVQSSAVMGQGVIEPAERISLIAQVSGVVKKIHSELTVGCLLSKGDRLVQLDPTDFSIAVREAKARVKIAQQELNLESGRRQAAAKEWALMATRRQGKEVSDEARDRALRTPQAEIAKSQLKIAKSALARAQVGYSRTRLKAPFNAVVLTESVDQGQLVGPGAPIASLAGTDAFWVTVSIPTSELGWINFPQRGKKSRRRKLRDSQRGSKAVVRYDLGARIIEREGYVIRQLTQVESTGRMARIVVEIRDPLGLKDDQEGLLLGAQVEVQITGRSLGEVIELPRTALHNEDELWVFNRNHESSLRSGGDGMTLDTGVVEGTLEVRKVKILRKRRDSVIISEGLSSEDNVVMSRVSTPVPGMRLRATL